MLLIKSDETFAFLERYVGKPSGAAA